MNNSEHKRLETAVILARMYGIKETLEPQPFVSNEDIVMLVTEWAEEYLDTGEKDITRFFEGKFCDIMLSLKK